MCFHALQVTYRGYYTFFEMEYCLFSHDSHTAGVDSILSRTQNATYLLTLMWLRLLQEDPQSSFGSIIENPTPAIGTFDFQHSHVSVRRIGAEPKYDVA
jgi:hypothetical protein